MMMVDATPLYRARSGNVHCHMIIFTGLSPSLAPFFPRIILAVESLMRLHSCRICSVMSSVIRCSGADCRDVPILDPHHFKIVDSEPGKDAAFVSPLIF